MSAITFLSTLPVAKFTWGQQRQDMEFRSIFGVQALEISTPLWIATIVAPTGVAKNFGAWQSYMMQLKGRTNQAAVYNKGRPQPLGTMRGAMTFNSNAVAGDTTLSIIASGQAYLTLLAGDYIGFGSGTTQQVVMVISDTSANSSGVISVNVQPPLRNAFSAGSAITWDKPCALFRQKQNNFTASYVPGGIVENGLVLDLIEDWRA